MNVEDYKVALSTRIRGDPLLKLLCSELKSSKWRELRSGDDFEEVGYNMDFGEKLLCTSESWKVRGTCRYLRWVKF